MSVINTARVAWAGFSATRSPSPARWKRLNGLAARGESASPLHGLSYGGLLGVLLSTGVSVRRRSLRPVRRPRPQLNPSFYLGSALRNVLPQFHFLAGSRLFLPQFTTSPDIPPAPIPVSQRSTTPGRIIVPRIGRSSSLRDSSSSHPDVLFAVGVYHFCVILAQGVVPSQLRLIVLHPLLGIGNTVGLGGNLSALNRPHSGVKRYSVDHFSLGTWVG